MPGEMTRTGHYYKKKKKEKKVGKEENI